MRARHPSGSTVEHAGVIVGVPSAVGVVPFTTPGFYHWSDMNRFCARRQREPSSERVCRNGVSKAQRINIKDAKYAVFTKQSAPSVRIEAEVEHGDDERRKPNRLTTKTRPEAKKHRPIPAGERLVTELHRAAEMR